jgi:hypothetical protein
MQKPIIMYRDGSFEIDMTQAKMVAQCDNCKQSVNLKKPKKDKDGKESGDPLGIQATLETGTNTGETKDFHFCDEECLRQYLNKRGK